MSDGTWVCSACCWFLCFCCWVPLPTGSCPFGRAIALSSALNWWILLLHFWCCTPADSTRAPSPFWQADCAILQSSWLGTAPHNCSVWTILNWRNSGIDFPSPGASYWSVPNISCIVPWGTWSHPSPLKTKRHPPLVWLQSCVQRWTGRASCFLCWFRWRSWRRRWVTLLHSFCFRIWRLGCRGRLRWWGSCIVGRSFGFGSSSSSRR